MEQLIIFIIIAIVSSLFGKSKHKEQKQMPPFNKDTTPQPLVIMQTEESQQERPQSFEDFARTFLGNANSELPKDEVIEVVEPVASDVTLPSPVEPPNHPAERTSVGRMTAGKKETPIAASTSHSVLQLPTSKKALMQAVVMAEVLGPPKAKRK